MKAKEYFDLYDRAICEEVGRDCVEVNKLLLALSGEAKDICDKRHSSNDLVTYAILRELNQKWNAICNLFERKYQVEILRRNGFKEFWVLRIPDLKGKI